MKSFVLASGELPYMISAYIILCGDDMIIVISGGEKEHVGAVALGSPRPSLENSKNISSNASLLCLLGHKDDILAREAALRLSRKYNKNVVVTVGIHIDRATGDDLKEVEKNFHVILNMIEDMMVAI
ncbi:proteasome assembly chaperone 4 family protein [uncultured Phascolarctobacterium sp.]|uniref:proteasome assembly chaperone 4 family protein n=1 Tax=uncultured Phascolarctobacterium sp. TaxID=512296 RepID=UPI0025F6B8A6|nr:proteasome assembly chaperone 4 family protein [uncultured Phascolarctobacterium sp.]MDO5379997.1 proteasome assembly chaperone 4 family protein [Acidaminococcaceae bacterium]